MPTGFIGTGAITEHVIVGLMEHGGFSDSIIISERSQTRSARLAMRYSNIRVEADNQAIVEQAETVFIGTLPQQTLDVLSVLSFREDQIIVSMAAMVSVEQVTEKVQPASRVHRIIPMPPNELGVGPIPIYPPSKEIEAILSSIGTVVPVDHEQHFSTFSASSAVMATFFELVAANARWIQSTGVPGDQAAQYSQAVFHSLATQAMSLNAQQLQEISAKCLTAGGLNEQLLHATQREGWFDELSEELGRILDRVQ